MKLPPRRHIPVETKCRVALNQLGEMWPDDRIKAHRGKLGELLADLKTQLAQLLDCEVSDLRLDHHPALENRRKIKRHGKIVGYVPHELAIDCLLYREKHAHHIKTNVRGERGQFADNVIAKRERKRLRKASLKAVAGKPVCAFAASVAGPRKFKAPKKRWGSRPLRSRNTFERRKSQ